MSALIPNAGPLIAIDRGDRQVLAQVEDADRAGDPVRANAMLRTCGHCVMPRGSTLWWSTADRADGPRAGVRLLA
jgi:hypothetical protein